MTSYKKVWSEDVSILPLYSLRMVFRMLLVVLICLSHTPELLSQELNSSPSLSSIHFLFNEITGRWKKCLILHCKQMIWS